MVLGFYQVVIDGVSDPETIETLAAIRAMEILSRRPNKLRDYFRNAVLPTPGEMGTQ